MQGMLTRRCSVVSFIALLMALASCGESPLEHAGEASTGWIGDGTSVTTTTTTAPSAPSVELMTATGLSWTNDRLVQFTAQTPAAVIGLAWEASSGRESYVQAHRQTIARAVPRVKVPGAVPDDVVYVTSQLVFGSTPGELSEEWLAAFGFWTVVPYSHSRSVGQSVVLHIGQVVRDRGFSCEKLPLAVSQICRDEIVAGLGEASEVVAPDGVTLRWDDGEYHYRLFCRTDSPEMAALIAGSMMELTDIE